MRIGRQTYRSMTAERSCRHAHVHVRSLSYCSDCACVCEYYARYNIIRTVCGRDALTRDETGEKRGVHFANGRFSGVQYHNRRPWNDRTRARTNTSERSRGKNQTESYGPRLKTSLYNHVGMIVADGLPLLFVRVKTLVVKCINYAFNRI